MALIDFDGLFDEKLAIYMDENKDKYTEKQWEDVIPKLYKKFGDTYVAKVKCTPKEYYARMSDTELSKTLAAHLKEDVPVPEFLCAEIESRGAVETLLPFLDSEDEQTVSYAVNLILDDPRVHEKYFELLEKGVVSESVLDDIADIFKHNADAVYRRALGNYRNSVAKEYMLEILSRVKARDDEIFEVLLKEFRTGENVPMRASYLAAYGDDRALPYLMERIEDRTIGFVEFQELKYAIEALGGEYDEERDFSEDKDYIAVEDTSAKFSSGLKS